MDKKRPTYNLEDIKEALSSQDLLRITRTARKSVIEMGLRDSDVINIIQRLEASNFYKSMTSYQDHRVWQDVYHTKYGELILYLKFTIDSEGFFVLSFKEK
jgi:motility quorum-sensing regulator/GCU-specific mRNA interferase toxin